MYYLMLFLFINFNVDNGTHFQFVFEKIVTFLEIWKDPSTNKEMARRTTNGPSLFTAVQITNKELKQRLRKVKKKAIDDNYYAKNYIVPLEEAQVRITVFDTTDKEFAREEFNRVLEENREELSRM